MSAGFDSDNSAKVFINDNHILVDKNESNNFRGLHIIVISPKNGHVIAAKVFDTYKSSAGLNDFLNSDIPKGSIIAAACQDECSEKLSEKAKYFF